ncbi:pyruvate kinase [Bacillus sp. SD088]|uniref:pyruvate kinase n=1 Tax=Bacillus sp. SD088 TaxID=2782012 RepID=UPI001A95653D|nr:pyruvate kinase [Bacillus sp. SD088]MBO0995993.1 hypothetical protein [Bacillus sp. SD088]
MDKGEITQQLIQLREEMGDFLLNLSEAQHINMADASKQNLCAFLALQKFKSPALHSYLVEEGFSSIQMMSPHVLYSLDKIISHLSLKDRRDENYIDRKNAIYLKEQRNQELLGKSEEDSVSIMVTLDKPMLETPEIFKELLRAGMTIARINLARDYSIWKTLVENIRAAEKEMGIERQIRKCKIYMDLPGPKVRVNDFWEKQVTIKVKKGDMIRIYKTDNYLGGPKSKKGEPASIGVTIPKALRNVRTKDKVYFDDGKICGVVVEVNGKYLDVKIILTRNKVEYIKPHKGINLPDSLVCLNVPAVTDTDMQMLSEVISFVDIVGISFIHSPNDIRIVKGYLEQYTERKIGIIAKIETKHALVSLSNIILEGLNLNLFGVMIARGDLAIEIGYKQLVKAQEEILEMCRAAHVPVIWATGILNDMNKKGIPLRTELTDAFMGLRADCIMMNKGPYISKSLEFLQELDQINKGPLLEFRNST